MRYYPSALIATILLISVSVTGCSEGSSKTAANDTPKSVILYTIGGNGSISSSELPGRVEAAREVNMAFKVSGTLQRVYVDEGSHVRKGQLIAEIDPRDYRLQLEATEAEYLKVKAEAERVIAMYSDSVVTADAYDKARYGLRQITAKYDNARNQVADTRIYAPFDGYVQRRFFDPPTVVGAGTPVVAVVSGSRPEVEINIPASTYLNLDQVTGFEATFDVLPGRKVPLRFISAAPKANANQLYNVRLAVPDDMKPQPSPGMTVMVSLSMAAAADTAAIAIPASALFENDGESYVWVYNPTDSIVNARQVAVESLHTDGTATIATGLRRGESIVTAGVHHLSDKQRVKPQPQTSKTNVGGLL